MVRSRTRSEAAAVWRPSAAGPPPAGGSGRSPGGGGRRRRRRPRWAGPRRSARRPRLGDLLSARSQQGEELLLGSAGGQVDRSFPEERDEARVPLHPPRRSAGGEPRIPGARPLDLVVAASFPRLLQCTPIAREVRTPERHDRPTAWEHHESRATVSQSVPLEVVVILQRDLEEFGEEILRQLVSFLTEPGAIRPESPLSYCSTYSSAFR